VHLVDTNVISEFVRPKPSPHVADWLRGLDELVLSVVTVEELLFGLAIRRSARVEQQVRALLSEHSRVLPVDERVVERSATLRAARQLVGRPLNLADALIAATAVEHRLVVATRNVRDFEGLGVRVFNPF
jgi:toxin FitB